MVSFDSAPSVATDALSFRELAAKSFHNSRLGKRRPGPMELRDYWRVFRRRAWIPVVLALAAVLTAGIIAHFSNPTYTAGATVVAKGPTSSVYGIAPVVSFPQAATSNTVAAGVIQKLGLHESVDHLVKRIRATWLGNNLFRVTVTDPHPDSAAAVANEVASEAAASYLQLGAPTTNIVVDEGLAKARDYLREQYVVAATANLKFRIQHPNAGVSKDYNLVTQALQLQVEEDAAASAYRGVLDQMSRDRLLRIASITGFDARVVDQAVATPDTSGHVVNVVSAGAIALVLGIGLVFLLDYLDTAIRAPEVAEEIVGAPVIGVIPRATIHSLRSIKGGG
jgi:capsular polysaccharide biosynthesis protein